MSETTSKYKRLLFRLVQLLISALAIYYVFTKVDFSRVSKLYAQANWWYMIAALLLFALSKLVSARRLWFFFRQVGVNISMRYNVKLYLLGMFYNLGLPTGLGGDGYKVWLLKKQFPGIKTKDIAAATLMDRLAGMTMLSVLIVIFFSFLRTPFSFLQFTWVLIIPGILLFYFIIHRWFRYFKPIFYRIHQESLIVQVFQVGAAVCILRALGEYNQLNPYVVLFLISSVAAILPVTIGGLGLREAVLLEGAGILGLEENVAVGLGLGFYLIMAITSLSGAWFAFGKHRVTKVDNTPETNE